MYAAMECLEEILPLEDSQREFYLDRKLRFGVWGDGHGVHCAITTTAQTLTVWWDKRVVQQVIDEWKREL
jgi:hypothetical protein